MNQPVHNLTRTVESRMKCALTSARMVGFEWDLDTGRVEVYGAVAELFGSATDHIEQFFHVIHPDDRPAIDRAVRAARDHGTYNAEYRITRPDGSTRWLCSAGAAERDPSGRAVRITGLTRDVTDEKQSEQQLKSINETLEQRVALRTAELHRRTEQLRLVAAELIQTEQRERRRLAQVLHDNLQQLLVAGRMRIGRLVRRAPDPRVAADAQQVDQLIAEAIDASRSLTIELSPPILYEAGLVAALDWLARQMQEKHGLDVELRVEDTPEPRTQEVRILLFMAVRELLFNVLKHAGTHHARLIADTADGQVRLAVEDRGVGFDLATLDHAASGETRSGFGLFSVRERVQLLGGSFEIRSSRGAGTRSVISMPVDAGIAAPPAPPTPQASAAAPHQPAPAHPHAPEGSRLRVLLADDHATVREGLAGLLREQPGIEVIGEAENGARAVELARALCPDVIVMDVTMPVLNGVEATRRITRICPGVRVVGLSMHEREDMAAEMINAGAATYLTKGIHFDTLIAAIRG